MMDFPSNRKTPKDGLQAGLGDTIPVDPVRVLAGQLMPDCLCQRIDADTSLN
jgi:hypothetical protein